MSHARKIKEVGRKFGQLVRSLRSTNGTCEVTNDLGQTVAVVLPAERYASYQAYLREREADFAVFDQVAEAFKDVDPDELQARINQAVDEVKAESRG